MTSTQTLEQPILANCASCPYFQDFGETNGRGLCQLFDRMARRHHLRTGDCDQEIKAVAEAQQPAPPPTPQPKQPAGFSGDLIGCQLLESFEAPQRLELEPQPTSKLETEFDIGRIHGRNDALAGWHPIYPEPMTDYALAYLAGYNAVLNPTDQQQAASKPLEWSVCLDPRWGTYQAWVGNRCIGHASTYESAERKAQAYVATDVLIKRQNEAVMASYGVRDDL